LNSQKTSSQKSNQERHTLSDDEVILSIKLLQLLIFLKSIKILIIKNITIKA